MSTDIQNKLNELSSQCDHRVSVFEVEITGLDTLSGRVLNKIQVDDLHRLFPNLRLDTASIKILNQPNLSRLHVATNITGLYGKPTFGMPLSSELYFGTDLEVLEEKDRWVFTRQKDGYLGWAYKPYLSEEAAKTITHLITAPVIELRAEPDSNREVLTRAVSGTGVTAQKIFGDWINITANKTGWVSSSALRPIKDLPQTIGARRAILVQDSMRMIGVPYLWGGTSGNGLDCSGFVRLLHRWIGIEIPRDSDMQASAAKRVEPPFEIGDLLFFGEGDGDRRVTHVGMSLGGWKIIHSSRGQNGVYIDDVQEKESLRKIYMHAGSFLR
jgi:cell wall-associated NlpC family hydrolase